MIPNFQQVADQIWRGGQPQTPQDWQSLVDLGMSQSIKLNLDSEGEDDVPSGVTLFKCPVDKYAQVIQGPDAQVLVDAVGFIGPGTFVHCLHGQDRTGLVIAMWRVVASGWTKEQAEREMLGLGFHQELLGLWLFWTIWQPSQ